MGQEFTMHAMIYPTDLGPATPKRVIMSSTDRMGISINASTDKFDFYVYDTNYRVLTIPGFTIPTNDWTHVGMTYKSNVLTAYIN